MANTLTVHNPEIWSRYLLKNFHKKTVMAGAVSRKLEDEIAQGGDLVRRQKIGTVSVANYTPGTDITPNNVVSTELTMDLDQKKAFAFFIDLTEQQLATNKVDLVMEYTKEAAYTMALTVDTFLLAKSGDVDAGNLIGSTANPITLTPDNVYEYFVLARKTIRDDDDTDDITVVVDNDTESLILRSPDFIKATSTGDSVIRNGEIGRMAGIKVLVSNNIATTSGCKDLMFFTQNFMDFAMRIPADYIKPYEEPKQFGDGRKGLMLYGGKVFHPTSGAVIRKAA